MQKAKMQKKKTGKRAQKIDASDYGNLFHWTHDGFAPMSNHVLMLGTPDEKTMLGASLGLQLSNTESIIELLKDGLPIHSFEKLGDAIHISSAELADSTHIAPRTLARRKKGGKLQLAESERVFRLAMLFDRAIDVLGDEAQARRWFKTPLKALSEKSPLEYSDTEIGAREVGDLLGRLEHGVFS